MTVTLFRYPYADTLETATIARTARDLNYVCPTVCNVRQEKRRDVELAGAGISKAIN